MRISTFCVATLLIVAGLSCSGSTESDSLFGPGARAGGNTSGGGGSGGNDAAAWDSSAGSGGNAGTGVGGNAGAGGAGNGGSGGGAAGGGNAGSAGAGVECTGDGDCTNSVHGKFCDTALRICVVCVPSNDKCPQGEYCNRAWYTCAPGCKATADCRTASPDGGGSCAAMTCDGIAHECVGCCIDNDCPLGNICDTGSGSCVPGCTAQHGCDGARTCCTGQCYDLNTDVDRCGKCNNPCSLPNATPRCVAGVCGVRACNAGFGDCNGNPADGCEFDVSSDPHNCGGCGSDCTTRTNVASASCSSSQCVFTCKTGFGDCNTSRGDGCEADLSRDTNNCGACGALCPTNNSGTGTCAGGACTLACRMGHADCDGNTSTGCEADLNRDTNNCGKCGFVCGSARTWAATCAAGRCNLICQPTYSDCNQDPSDGCEHQGDCP